MEQHKINDDALIEAYNKNPQLSIISAQFNVPEISIWRRCKQLGLEFRNGGLREKIPTDEILKGNHPQYQTNKLRKRILRENILENKCSVCGLTEWMGNPITLQLDHINGKPKDHRLENLRLICPNCHSQTDTWCGKNK